MDLVSTSTGFVKTEWEATDHSPDVAVKRSDEDGTLQIRLRFLKSQSKAAQMLAKSRVGETIFTHVYTLRLITLQEDNNKWILLSMQMNAALHQERGYWVGEPIKRVWGKDLSVVYG